MTKIQSINPNKLYIAQNAEVSLKLAGNIAQVTFMAGKNKKCPIKNLSKDEFVDLSTSDVKKRRHAVNRVQSPKSVRKSINSLMDLIRCNATNPNICKWITLMGNVLTSTEARGNVTTSAYDDKGNLTSVTDAAGNSISIAYNDKNQAVRLTNINDDDIIINYDSAGSIISTTDADGYKTLYNYNDRNQPVTEETPEGKFTYSYDANGNLVSKSESVLNPDGSYGQAVITESYTYDSFNRMIRYASGDISYSYTYDAEGVRRSKQNDNVQESKITYISDTLCEYSQTLAEINRSGELNTSYTIGLELISLTRGEEEYYYISDGHGDVRIITDEDGHVKTKYRYSGYGELIETSGDIENSHMYAGECYDEESGLYYLRARYMNPSTGTFTGMDSYAGNISDPDTLHKYLYANGNPVKYVDPSGNMATMNECLTAIGIENKLQASTFIFWSGALNAISKTITTALDGGDTVDILLAPIQGFALGGLLVVVDMFLAYISGVLLLDIIIAECIGYGYADVYNAIESVQNGHFEDAWWYLLSATGNFTLAGCLGYIKIKAPSTSGLKNYTEKYAGKAEENVGKGGSKLDLADYYEYKALKQQGYNASEAYGLMKQFRDGINPNDDFIFHFTTYEGGKGITDIGGIKGSKSGFGGKGIYAGTTPTPSWALKHIPIGGWGLGKAPVRIPIKITPNMEIKTPILPLFKTRVIPTDFIDFN